MVCSRRMCYHIPRRSPVFGDVIYFRALYSSKKILMDGRVGLYELQIVPILARPSAFHALCPFKTNLKVLNSVNCNNDV